MAKKFGLTPEQKAAKKAAKKQKADNKAVSNLVGPDARGAKVLSDRFFQQGSLGRVDEARPGEVQDILDKSKAFEELYRTQPRSADQQDIVERRKAGLEGYTGAELQAQREAANRETYDAYKQRMGELVSRNASSGFSGPAQAGAQAFLERDLARGLARSEQDLFIRNADEKQRRLGEYSDTISGLESEEYNRRRGSLQDYEGYLNRAREDELTRRQENLDRIAAESAGRVSTYFGGLGIGRANKADAYQRKYGQAYLDTLRYGYDKSVEAAALSGAQTEGPPPINPGGNDTDSSSDGKDDAPAKAPKKKKQAAKQKKYGYKSPSNRLIASDV
ncbi:MAG: hypothetical protein E6Q97_36180 [Desulfurellales bacterium]|nr:MAG: hypothetical protein E6Q97_36180 [Desulfurellales bacterium]